MVDQKTKARPHLTVRAAKAIRNFFRIPRNRFLLMVPLTAACILGSTDARPGINPPDAGSDCSCNCDIVYGASGDAGMAQPTQDRHVRIQIDVPGATTAGCSETPPLLDPINDTKSGREEENPGSRPRTDIRRRDAGTDQ